MSGPHGNFYYDSLRDSLDIVAIAGGTGITPIRSMVREMFAGDLDMRITLLYGIRTPDCAVFSKNLICTPQESQRDSGSSMCAVSRITRGEVRRVS